MDILYREEALKLFHDNRYSDALKLFLNEEIDPAEDADLAYYMGLCYARLGDNDEALRLLQQVIDQEINLGRLYQIRMLIAWMLIDGGEIDRAEEQLNKVLLDGFFSPQTWSALGYCRWARGDTNTAIESYQRALDLDKENSNAANGMGFLLAETGENLSEAVELCQQAYDSNPGNAAYEDSLGWALFQSGQVQKAVLHLAQALSKCPNDEVIAGHLEAVRVHAPSD